MSDVFAIIDGHAQFFRAYYAIRGGMNSPVTGEPTQMAFGFMGMLLKLLRQLKPRWLVVVIDAAGDQETFRSDLYPEYKAHRQPPPEDFGGQVERCLALLKTLGIPVLAVERVEADDVIATLVKRVRSEQPHAQVRIVSKDKDLGQLIDSNTALYDAQTDVTLSAEALFDSKGVKPEQVVDMLTLMGDSVDNVPGVPGIGPKTAAQLVTQYGSLEGVLANLDKLTPKRRESIQGAAATLALARQLVRLKDDCEFRLSLADATVDVSRADAAATLEMLRVLGFRGLTTEVARLLGVEGGAAAASERTIGSGATPPASGPTLSSRRGARRAPEDPEQGSLFGSASEEPIGDRVIDRRTPGYRRIATVQGLESFLNAARLAVGAGAGGSARAAGSSGSVVAFDTETDSLSKVSCRLVGISLSVTAGEAVYIPLRSSEPSTHLSLEQALPVLGPFFADASVPKTAHNLKFDLQVLWRHGFTVRGISGDSMVESYLCEPERPTHGLDSLAETVLGHRCIPISQLIGTGKHQRTFDQVDLAVATEYAAEDADVAGQLHHTLVPRLKSLGMESLLRDVELPLVEVLARMELAGIKVDGDELDRQRIALQTQVDELRHSIQLACPHPINPDSPRQLALALFNRPDQDPPGLGLRVIKKTTTGASTDSEVLERLASDPDANTELPRMVLDYRQLTKLVGTYLGALKDCIEPSTGRIHASFHQTGTATGRLSSSEPNLQNIPIRTPVGKAIRRAFIAEPGFVLVSADYSQIELRILAHLSQDPGLLEAFHRGADIHTAVAAEVNGVPLEQVTSAQRSAAKMVNFGIVYGITAFGLARRLGPGASVERAREIIENYRARFAGINQFLESCIQLAKDQGFVSTILGRCRSIPQVHSRNPAERAFGERIAVNSVVQGSAADLIKVAMVRVDRALARTMPKARLLLQIHDELVLEVPEAQAEQARVLMIEEMKGAMKLTVPLEVEAACGANWSLT